jgi:hypothetical protein
MNSVRNADEPLTMPGTSRWTPETHRAVSRANMRKLREQRKAAGLCKCGRPPEPGKRHCLMCLANLIDWVSLYRLRLRRRGER